MNTKERAKRWALILGGESETSDSYFSPRESQIYDLLNTLYPFDRDSHLKPSDPQIARWVRDVKNLFPNPVLQLIQRDAISIFGVSKLLSNEDFVNTIVPDIHLISTILSLKNALPEKTFPLIRILVGRLVQDLEKKLKPITIDRIKGLRLPAQRTSNPRSSRLDWNQTIKRNLKNFYPEIRTIIPEKFYVHPPTGQVLHQIILLLDQSASMASSVIYTGIFGAILSKIRTLKTNLILFDTEVTDMSDHLDDPVDLLMKVQLSGGTNIQRAVRYVDQIIENPWQVHVILISDLYEGPPVSLLREAVKVIKTKTTSFTVLLALDDEGTPFYHTETGKTLASLDIPVLACSPDLFPDLMAKILNGQEINQADGFSRSK